MKLIAIMVCALLAIPAAAQNSVKDIEAKLRADYVGHLVALRTPGLESELKYDDSGAPIAKLTPAPLVNGGAFVIEKIRVSASEVRFEGRRIVLTGKNFDAVGTNEKIVVSVSFRVPLMNESQVHEAMSRLFLTPQEFNEAKLGYVVNLKELKEAKPGEQVATLKGNVPVFKVGDDVTVPRAAKMPDPDYSDQARREGIQGTVVLQVIVNEEGIPAYLEVSRPLGYGLDQKAVEALSTWRFVPAKRNGVPVAVRMDVEFNFSLGSTPTF